MIVAQEAGCVMVGEDFRVEVVTLLLLLMVEVTMVNGGSVIVTGG